MLPTKRQPVTPIKEQQASDTLDGNLTSNVVTTGTVDTTTPGTYTLTYTVSDAAGNGATTQQRTITVEDTTAPVITLKAMPQLIFGYGKPTPRMEPLRAIHSTVI